MNALCYKIVFSKRLGSLVAVGEHTSGQGKTAGGTGTRSSVTHHGLASTLKASTFAIALGLMAHSAYAAGLSATALPTGASVNAGNVAISTQGAAMTIQQSSNKASVNWNSFNIGSAAAVNITQPSANSVLLNRVVGNDPSQIFGKLTANGQVVLINPNGVVFGQGGSVTASTFTASTFGLSDDDFAKGKYKYTRNGSTAGVTVQNSSSLNATAPGGYVALIGARVNNEGTISTKQGSVIMAAGESAALPSALTDNVSVPLSGKVRLELAPSSINAGVTNSGAITTEGGQVLIQAAAISDAVASITHSGSINTTGAQGGAVTLQADGGNILVSGTVTANSTDAGRAGGSIIIGRDEEAGALAKVTDVSGAQLESYGGFAETSGAYLKATHTKVIAKEWLLDPTNITIAAAGTTPSGTTYAANYTAGADSVILASDISNSLSSGTSVTISTSASGASAGNIAVNESIAKTGGANANLTLKAHGDIIVAAGKTITSDSGKLNVVFNSDFDGNGSGGIGLLTGSGITTNGGSVTLGGGTTGDGTGAAVGSSVTSYGITLVGASISTGSGNVSLNGTSINSASNKIWGVNIDGGTTIATTTGNVNITATGQTTGQNGYGMLIQGASTKVSTDTGNIMVTSTGSKSASGDSVGIQIRSAGAFTTNAGNISLTGTSRGTGGNNNIGINFNGSGSVIATGNGTVNIDGIGSSVGSNSSGIYGINVTTSGGAANIKGATTCTAGTCATDINVYNSTINTTGGNITFTANSYMGNGAEVINAGTGIATIQNRTAGTLIDLGGVDASSTLGISNIELNRIIASTTKIGSTTAGNLTVSTPITTNATTGNLYLQSGGSATINASSAMKSAAGLFIQTAGGSIINNSTLSGTNITLDNSNGTINQTSGYITTGSATSSSASDAIGIKSAITATGNININGATSVIGGKGVNIASALTTSNGNLNIVGKNTNNGDTVGTGVYINALIKNTSSSNKAVTIKGASAGAGGAVQIASAGVDAGNNNILIQSTNGSWISQNSGTIKGANVSVDNTGATVNADGTLGTRGNLTSSSTTNTGINAFAAVNLMGGINATGNINVLGAHSGLGFIGINVSTGSITTSGGNINITGNNTNATSGNWGMGVVLTGNTSINDTSATGSQTITIKGSTGGASNTGNAIKFVNNGSINSYTNNVVIQATDGNQIRQDSGSTFTGKNISIDNTNGSINTTTGMIIAGGGVYAGNNALNLSGAMTASGNINIQGNASGSNVGVNLAGGPSNIIKTTGSNASINISSNSSITENTAIQGTNGANISIVADRDLLIQQAISTTNATSIAITLESGKSAAAGTSTGGDVKVTGSGAVSVGRGGRVTYLTGSIAGSALVGVLNGNNRYNSDELTTNYTAALGSGTYAIFREAPALTLQVNNVTKTYDGLIYSGGSISAIPITGTYRNGDIFSIVTQNVSFSGEAQGKKNVADSGKNITASDNNGKNALGYVVTYVGGALTINKAAITLSDISAANKTYDGNSNASISNVTLSGLVGSESLGASATGSFDNKNAGSRTATVFTDNITLSDNVSSGGLVSNYKLVSGSKSNTATIAQKDITLSSITADSKTYDGNSNASISNVTLSGLVGSESLGASATGSFDNKNAGSRTATVSTDNITLSDNVSSGGLVANYNLVSGSKTASATIDKAQLILLASTDSKTYDGTTSSNAAVQMSGLVMGDSANATQAFVSKNALGTKGSTLQVNSGYVVNDGNGGKNYAVKLVDAPGTVAPKVLTPTYAEPSKKMDGTTQATVEATPSTFGVLGTDDVTIAQSATYDTPTAGTSKTVTVRNIALSGKDNGNYALKSSTTTVKGTIVAVPPIVVPPVVIPAQASSSSGKSGSGGGANARIAIGDANPFQLASVPGAVEEVCSSTNLEKCHCKESSLDKNVSLCYEPK